MPRETLVGAVATMIGAMTSCRSLAEGIDDPANREKLESCLAAVQDSMTIIRDVASEEFRLRQLAERQGMGLLQRVEQLEKDLNAAKHPRQGA